VFGGTSSSRLFQEVRERRGLAYAIHTFENLYAGTGEVGLYVGTRPENLAGAMSVIAAELEKIAAGPISDAELERARENLKGRVVLALESTGARMERLGASVLVGMEILDLDEVVARIDAVGPADVAALASELFAPARLSAAGIGPDEEAFARALEPLGAEVLL
jgi:predicted Zn-dependent peptidase